MKSLFIFILKIITLVLLFPLFSVPGIFLLRMVNTWWVLAAQNLLTYIMGGF